MALRTLSSKRTLGLGFRHARSVQTFSLADLPYDYGALEPVISGEIMKIHHQKHHQIYITNYNKALEQYDEARAKGDAPKVVHLQSAIKFNGGGHINHSVFWKNLKPVSRREVVNLPMVHLVGQLTQIWFIGCSSAKNQCRRCCFTGFWVGVVGFGQGDEENQG